MIGIFFQRKQYPLFLRKKKKLKILNLKILNLVDIKKKKLSSQNVDNKKENKENICVNGLSLVLDQKFLLINL